MHGFSESVKSKLEGDMKGHDFSINGVGEYCKQSGKE